MGKLFLFYLIWRLSGNPILAIILILVIYYFVDRRFIGLLPSISRPLRRHSRISHLRRLLQTNPHDAPAKQELAEAYMEGRHYGRALQLLEQLPERMKDEPHALCDKGLCLLETGKVEEGKQLVLSALERDARLRYGEPWLKLAFAVAATNPDEALQYQQKFQSLNVSSCASWYLLGQLYSEQGDKAGAVSAWRSCIDTYRSLPPFRKRVERKYALRSRWRMLF